MTLRTSGGSAKSCLSCLLLALLPASGGLAWLVNSPVTLAIVLVISENSLLLKTSSFSVPSLCPCVSASFTPEDTRCGWSSLSPAQSPPTPPTHPRLRPQAPGSHAPGLCGASSSWVSCPRSAARRLPMLLPIPAGRHLRLHNSLQVTRSTTGIHEGRVSLRLPLPILATGLRDPVSLLLSRATPPWPLPPAPLCPIMPSAPFPHRNSAVLGGGQWRREKHK